MSYRSVLLLVCTLGGAGSLGALTSCSGPDPGEIIFIERNRSATGESSGGSGNPGGGDGGGGGSSGGGGEGGASSSSGSSNGDVDPVFGTSVFMLGMPGPGAPAKNAAPDHGGDASGKNCMDCHAGNTVPAGPQWAFAGTLYTDSNSTTGVPNAEVRVTNPDGTEYAKTYTDVDGNFWVPGKATPIMEGSKVGVRTATLKATMVATINSTGGGCSQGGTCHGGGQGKMFLK